MQIIDFDSNSESDSDFFKVYNISVSQFCCPVCWNLIDVLNKMSKKVKFVVRAQHLNLYPVCLPPWLPDDVLDEMITRFRKMLFEGFCNLRDIVQPSPFIGGHSKNNA